MINDFNEYQRLAGETDDVPQQQRLCYYPLGLCGEVGEVTEKLYDITKNGSTAERCLGVAVELGDVCWFIARMCAYMDVEMFCLADRESPGALQYSVHNFDKTPIDQRLPKYQTDLNVSSAFVADSIKKAMRDNDGDWTYKTCDILNALTLTLVAVAKIAGHIGFPLAQVLQLNIDKLESRKRRGMINGSGDNR